MPRFNNYTPHDWEPIPIRSKQKYYNRKSQIDGFIFDSKKEMEYYLFLKEKKEKGLIKDFKIKEKFLLIPANDIFKSVSYISDFTIINLDDSKEVIDIKGYPTKEAILKRKLMYSVNKIHVKWLVFNKKSGWHEIEEDKKRGGKNG